MDAISVPALIPPGGLRSGELLVITVPDDPAGPVRTGHFPGLAIFPGVGLLECANQASLAALTAGGTANATLAAIESARFLSPVFPADEVCAATEITEVRDGWVCSVRLTVAGTPCALVRLRYRS